MKFGRKRPVQDDHDDLDLDADLPDDPAEAQNAIYKRMGKLVASQRDLAAAVDRRERRDRGVAVVAVLAIMTAGFAYRTAQREGCVARNAADVEILRVVDSISQPLPLNPQSPATVQQQIRERNTQSAAFRVSMHVELRPRSCPLL